MLPYPHIYPRVCTYTRAQSLFDLDKQCHSALNVFPFNLVIVLPVFTFSLGDAKTAIYYITDGVTGFI